MTEEQNKYKFDNLQPIAFLRKFNKMADEDQKQPLKTFRKQLKVFPLTKFPLPPFYQRMEGIFETGTKKKDIMNLNLKSKDDVVDEQFMAKHRQFMTKAIQKIIKQNKNQQISLENYKSQYQNNLKPEKKPKKSQSESKLAPNKKLRSTSGKNDSTKDYNTIQKSFTTYKQEMPQQSKTTYLQKVQIERLQSLRNIKKEKIRMKQDSKINDFLESQQNFMTERLERGKLSQLSQIPTARSIEYNDLKVEDWKKVFIQELLSLQKQQSDYQIKYCEQVQGQIKRFNDKVKQSIQKTKKQKYW